MSNSRIFCWGFVAWCMALTVFAFAGAEPKFIGFERTVGNFIIGATWGIAAIALFGDRKPRT